LRPGRSNFSSAFRGERCWSTHRIRETNTTGPGYSESERAGTGFVWDGAGHVVTNNHVVSGTREIAIRFATGEVVGASIVGTAPNHAVVKGQNPRNLPSPIAVGASAGQVAFAIASR
jgi:2-alkenal reductase